jgi:hypothetical protein
LPGARSWISVDIVRRSSRTVTTSLPWSRLRDAARSFLLAHCHEPGLVQEKVDLSASAQL